jgi:hypothetical protein
VQRLVGAASRGRPRIAGVSARQLGRRWLVRALVADRTRVSFAVEVVVVRLGGRLVVVRVVGD